MPALAPVPKVIRIGLKQTLSEDTDCFNRVYFQYSGAAPNDAQLSTMCGSIGTEWGVNISPNLCTHNTLTEVTAEDLTSATAAVGSATVSEVGSHSEVGLPAGTALVIRQVIARRYRGGHPRTYIAGMPYAALQDEQTWTTSETGAWLTGWSAFSNAIEGLVWSGGGTFGPVNVSYYEGFTNHTYPSGRVKAIPTPRATPLIDLITGWTINPHIASQRRRNQQRLVA